MRLANFTIWFAVIGFLVFDGYASWSGNWGIYSTWDEAYYTWLRILDYLFLLNILKPTYEGKKYFKILLPFFVERIIWELICWIWKVDVSGVLFRFENGIIFIWMLYIVNVIWETKKTFKQIMKGFVHKIKKR